MFAVLKKCLLFHILCAALHGCLPRRVMPVGRAPPASTYRDTSAAGSSTADLAAWTTEVGCLPVPEAGLRAVAGLCCPIGRREGSCLSLPASGGPWQSPASLGSWARRSALCVHVRLSPSPGRPLPRSPSRGQATRPQALFCCHHAWGRAAASASAAPCPSARGPPCNAGPIGDSLALKQTFPVLPPHDDIAVGHRYTCKCTCTRHSRTCKACLSSSRRFRVVRVQGISRERFPSLRLSSALSY